MSASSKQPRTTPTRSHLAELLGVTVRSLFRYLRRGLPEPAQGEALTAWRVRARAWLRDSVSAPGRPRLPDPPAGADVSALAALRRARALRAEQRERLAARSTHEAEACRRVQRSRIDELQAAVAGLPDELARRLPGVEQPEEVASITTGIMRAIFDRLAAGDGDAGDDGPDQVALPDDAPAGLSGRKVADYWLERERAAKASSEGRALAADRGQLHDGAACDADELVRIANWASGLRAFAEGAWPSLLAHLPADAVRARVRHDLERAARALHGDAATLDAELAAALAKPARRRVVSQPAATDDHLQYHDDEA